jgi:hypothetical protein
MSTQVTGVLEPDMDSDADVTQYVADTAARLQDRLAQVSSGIQVTLENEIPELGGDRRDMEGWDQASWAMSRPCCAPCVTRSR